MSDLWRSVTEDSQYAADHPEGQRCRKKEHVKRLLLDLAQEGLVWEDLDTDAAVKLWALLAEGVDDLLLLIHEAARERRSAAA
jgi:hypothetical protein